MRHVSFRPIFIVVGGLVLLGGPFVRADEPIRFGGSGAAIADVAFSFDGEWVATGDEAGAVRVWRAADGTEVTSVGAGKPVRGIAFSRDGKMLAAAVGAADGPAGEVRLWSPEDGRALARIAPLPGPVVALAFCPTDEVLAYGMAVLEGKEARGEVRVRDVILGSEPRRLSFASPVHALAFAPDGRHLAVGCADGDVFVLDVGTGKLGPRIGTGSGRVSALAFRADGQAIASASGTPSSGEVVVRDAAGAGSIATYSAPSWVNDVAWSSSGDLALAFGRSLQIRSGASGEEKAAYPDLPGEARAVDVSRDGSRVAVAAGPVATVYRLGARRPSSTAPAARGEEPELGKLRLDGSIEIEPSGDARLVYVLDMAPATFREIRESAPDPYPFARQFFQRRADYVVGPGTQCRYEEAPTAIVVERRLLGAARHRGDGSWELRPEPGHVHAGRISDGFQFRSTSSATGFVEGSIAYRLPEGSQEAVWDPGRGVLSWRLASEGARGRGRLEFDLETPRRILATLYKLYGFGPALGDFAHLWAARTILRNEGTHVLRNVRVRYSMGEYADAGWSAWQRTAELMPGQTTVSLYHPVLDARVAQLRTNTPAKVRVQVEWEETDGRVRSDEAERVLVFLGVGDVQLQTAEPLEGSLWGRGLYPHANFLAAWVSRNDPVVRKLASLANKMAGGAAAGSSDAEALKVLDACYSLFLLGEVTYQHPPTLADRSRSFDPEVVQNVKFPRDVIHHRSGTCIDLAILYAAMVQEIGLRPYLVLIPGHCFPAVHLPGGNFVGIETTGVQGGLRFGSGVTFAKALEIGNQELREALESGTGQVVDLESLWLAGIPSPELGPGPGDPLKAWGDETALLERWQRFRQLACTGACARGRDNGCSCCAFGICGKATCAPDAEEATAPAEPSADRSPACTGTCVPGEANGCSCEAWGACGKGTCSPVPEAAPPAGPTGFAGAWRGRISHVWNTGVEVSYEVELRIAQVAQDRYRAEYVARVRIPTQDAGLLDCRIDQAMLGGVDAEGALVLEGASKVLTALVDGSSSDLPVDRLTARRAGARLIGRVGNDKTGWFEFDFGP